MAQTHYHANPTWRVQWSTMVLVLLLGAASLWIELREPTGALRWLGYGCAAAAAVMIIVICYRHFAWRFVIDDDTIESRRGIIGRSIRSIRIEDLRNINVSQSLIERLLGVGTIEFSTAAGGGVEVVFFGIEDPLAVKQGVQQLQERSDRAARPA